ncbi:hypothetical protein [Rhizobium giardinii]|uniref:hypothetical protein n=1 Tax=Rhizobium giardinii TaxID=56731 RepID=UPI0012B54A1B|nr:hypothetical protein [Rhizobium giardinii]
MDRSSVAILQNCRLSGKRQLPRNDQGQTWLNALPFRDGERIYPVIQRDWQHTGNIEPELAASIKAAYSAELSATFSVALLQQILRNLLQFEIVDLPMAWSRVT